MKRLVERRGALGKEFSLLRKLVVGLNLAFHVRELGQIRRNLFREDYDSHAVFGGNGVGEKCFFIKFHAGLGDGNFHAFGEFGVRLAYEGEFFDLCLCIGDELFELGGAHFRTGIVYGDGEVFRGFCGGAEGGVRERVRLDFVRYFGEGGHIGLAVFLSGVLAHVGAVERGNFGVGRRGHGGGVFYGREKHGFENRPVADPVRFGIFLEELFELGGIDLYFGVEIFK